MHLAFISNKFSGSNSLLDEEDFSEKRASPRVDALDISEILVGVGQQGFTCMVHDLSLDGARLEVTCGDLPERFILANHIKRTRTVCRVMWRNGNFLGVKFLSRPRAFSNINEN